ncbi:MAG TPA: hypothetical protein PKK01_10765 [Mycobacterium sp.]|nr:hypothetical protein [Mycobacterium sp.]HPZ94180.1 hypothetical protein [Mycobacterium sp.]HQE16110.1 hypothetical protein [Mycobacterium sp.]
MGEIDSDTKIHVVRAVAWKDAIIKLLEPSSPYRPWGEEFDAEPGDAVLVMLETEPTSVIAELVTIESRDGVEPAIARCMDTEKGGRPALLELETLAHLTGLEVYRDESGVIARGAAGLAEFIARRVPASGGLRYRQGHSTLAAARILLDSGGWCTGCRRELDLTAANARYHVHIHTVDADPAAPWTPVAYEPPEPVSDEYGPDSIRVTKWREPIRLPLDWPAALCDDCHDEMRMGGFTGFLDFRFSRHPRCPVCSARWTMRTMTSGFTDWRPREPWLRTTGCCSLGKWQCGACGHPFGGDDREDEPEDG